MSLASCCFKVLEHLIHARIAPIVNHQLSESQGGFCWGADALVGSLVNVLTMRASTHTFVAFVDIEKAFDISWVEATLVRMHYIGVRGLMWNLLSNFLRHTVSQIRLGNELSDQWLDSSIAQGRVLSPLLDNLLVDGLAVEVQLASPGVLLPGNFQCRFTDQLYADNLVLVADSPLDLQTALNAVHRWGCRFRFKFGVGPTKSTVMVFGPRRRFPDLDLHLGGESLPHTFLDQTHATPDQPRQPPLCSVCGLVPR